MNSAGALFYPHVTEPELRLKYFGCPYCGDRLAEPWAPCCGEAGHGTWLDEETGEEVESFQIPAGKRIQWEEA